MEGEGVYPARYINIQPDLPGGPWYHGRKLQITFTMPIECELEGIDDEEYELDGIENYNILMIYGNEAIPIMHDSVVEALTAAGVDNLELFPAVLKDPTTGKEYSDFKAFNVVGLVSAVDLNSSRLMHKSSTIQHLDTDFEQLNLAVPESVTLNLFRLEENCGAICVSEKVKAEIEKRNIPGIIFYASGEWSG